MENTMANRMHLLHMHYIIYNMYRDCEYFKQFQDFIISRSGITARRRIYTYVYLNARSEV